MNVAKKRWKEGLPIELETLALKVVNNSKRSNTNSDFIKSYCNNDEQSRKKLNVIIKGVLARHGLTVRKKRSASPFQRTGETSQSKVLLKLDKRSGVSVFQWCYRRTKLLFVLTNLVIIV